MNYKNAYFNRTLHPYEAIFIKTNRNLFNNQIQSISTHNLNKQLNTIIFIFYYNNENISEYINHKYIYLVRVVNYFDIYDFLASNTFLWINKENIGILLFNEITNINIVKYIDSYELVIVNNKIPNNYDHNILQKYLNFLNINEKKYYDFTSFITKTKYFINFISIYKRFFNNKKDNILLIKILTSYFSNLNIKTYINNDNLVYYKK
jgi:hypothetical protein